MKKAEVQIGEVYAVKVSGNVVPVVLDEEHPRGGWIGTNQQTNRQVRIKSAQRLRCIWDAYLGRGEAALGEPPDEATGRTRRPQGAKKPEAKAKATNDEKNAPEAHTARKSKASGLDAAAKVLEEANEPLSCKAIVERAFEKGYWQSHGKTPAATIYAAILREIQRKGEQARFRKIARGKFELAR